MGKKGGDIVHTRRGRGLISPREKKDRSFGEDEKRGGKNTPEIEHLRPREGWSITGKKEKTCHALRASTHSGISFFKGSQGKEFRLVLKEELQKETASTCPTAKKKERGGVMGLFSGGTKKEKKNKSAVGGI